MRVILALLGIGGLFLSFVTASAAPIVDIVSFDGTKASFPDSGPTIDSGGPASSAS